MITVVISVYKVANFPDGGGHFWVYMQYVQGLLRLGCNVYWLEQIMPPSDRKEETRLLATFAERMKRFGLEGKTLLYALDRDQEQGSGSFRFIAGTRSEAETVLQQADVLLNFHYNIDPRLLAFVRRTALVDIDPGLLQFWMSTGQLDVPPHDHYLTTGETVGTPDARFPDCGLPWVHIRPPVCLDRWPFIAGPRSEAFTTVSSWMTGDFLKVTENGSTFLRENTKRIAFLRFLDLPRHTRQPLELALYLVDADAEERVQLQRHGWRVRHSREVADSPETYRSYVQQSRGEFSCAKPSCIDLQNAWISDRTLCYLASGRPAVVQHTGPSAFLPDREGLFRFTTLEEAVEGLETINGDYERHCRAGRDIAEAYFDAEQVLARILNETLGPTRRNATAPCPASAASASFRAS
jgi:hypothetical protein